MPEFSPLVVLHAEQRLVMVSDTIEAGMEYATDTKILDVVDKGKNALVYFRLNTYQVVNGKEVLVFYHDQTIFLRGYGGFGFPGQGLPTYIPTIPESAPDITLQASTYPSQAFVFGLTNDLNPIHVDPKASAIQHFPKPILNGTYCLNTRLGHIWDSRQGDNPGASEQYPRKDKIICLQVYRVCISRRKPHHLTMENRKWFYFHSHCGVEKDQSSHWRAEIQTNT